MNAVEALKLANTRGAAAMLHARELAIRRKAFTEKVAKLHPLAIVGIGLGAGTVLGKMANRHPLVASATTVIAAILRYAPADTLMRLWESRSGLGAEEAVAATASTPAAAAADDTAAAHAAVAAGENPADVASGRRDAAIETASIAVGAKPPS